MKVVSSAALAGALVFGAAAWADHGIDKFAAMDANGDAVVTEAEFSAYMTHSGRLEADDASLQFAVLAGEDGVLLRDEYEAAIEHTTQSATHDTSEEGAMDGDTSSADPAEMEGE